MAALRTSLDRRLVQGDRNSDHFNAIFRTGISAPCTPRRWELFSRKPNDCMMVIGIVSSSRILIPDMTVAGDARSNILLGGSTVINIVKPPAFPGIGLRDVMPSLLARSLSLLVGRRSLAYTSIMIIIRVNPFAGDRFGRFMPSPQPRALPFPIGRRGVCTTADLKRRCNNQHTFQCGKSGAFIAFGLHLVGDD